MGSLVEDRKAEVEGQAQDDAQARGTGDRVLIPVGASFRGAKGDTEKVSKWRVISGITVENEKTLTAAERRAGIRKLKDVMEAEIRAELQATQEDADLFFERTYLWEPIPAI